VPSASSSGEVVSVDDGCDELGRGTVSAGCSVTVGVGSCVGADAAGFRCGRTVAACVAVSSLRARKAASAGRLEGVVGSRRSSEPVEIGSNWESSPLKSDMMPLNVFSHPGVPSVRLLSPDTRAGVDVPAPVPSPIAFFRSASLTLMLLRLLRLGIRACFEFEFDGHRLSVVVGDGEREWPDVSLTKTSDWSSRSEFMMLFGAEGRTLFMSDEDTGPPNTSAGSERGEVYCCLCFEGIGGTGGVKASMRGLDG